MRLLHACVAVTPRRKVLRIVPITCERARAAPRGSQLAQWGAGAEAGSATDEGSDRAVKDTHPIAEGDRSGTRGVNCGRVEGWVVASDVVCAGRCLSECGGGKGKKKGASQLSRPLDWPLRRSSGLWCSESLPGGGGARKGARYCQRSRGWRGEEVRAASGAVA